MNKKFSPMNDNLIFYIIKCVIIALVIGFVLTVLSAFIPITLYSYHDLDRMAFGKPFAFLIQSFSKPVNDAWFPGMVSPKFSDGYSTKIELGMFLVSFGINSVIGGIAVTCIGFLKKNRKKKK